MCEKKKDKDKKKVQMMKKKKGKTGKEIGQSIGTGRGLRTCFDFTFFC